MKIKKIFLSFIVSLSLIFSNIFVVPVSAADVPSWLQPIIDIKDSVEDAANITVDALKQSFIGALQGAGFIFDAGRVTTQALIDFLRGYNNGQFTNNNTASDQEVIDNASRYFINNTVLTDNSIEYNSNSKNLTVGLANDIINNSGFKYVYSYIFSSVSVSDFPNRDVYLAFQNIVNDTNNNFYTVFRGQGNWYCLTTDNDNIGFVVNGSNSPDNVLGYYGVPYDLTTWEYLGNYGNSEDFESYIYDSESLEFVESVTDVPSLGAGQKTLFSTERNKPFKYSWVGIDWSISYSQSKTYKIYMTLNDLKNDSVGRSSYFVSDKWSNFVNSNNSTYTVDSSNSNNISYGDTISYINNYYTDNGSFPDPTNIQIYIDNNIGPSPSPTPSPTPSPDDSGGSGSGGSGGSGGIDLGWLGTLGQLIGQIVSAIGNFFTGVLQGIVNALTSVLGFLSDTISSLGETLPNAFFDFIGAIFGWLPDPMMNTLKALFLMMVLVGVISIFRR